MPELPEVEVIRRELERDVVGKKIKEVVVQLPKSVRRHRTRNDFIKQLPNRRVEEVSRKGKYLLLTLSAGKEPPIVLVIHLGMSGQLIKAKTSREKLAPHTHVVIKFNQGGELRFVDPRTFGEMFVTTPAELTDVEELKHLGFDPLESPVSWQEFGRALVDRSVKLKTLLTDQDFIAGLGNIYADEILFEAALRFDRKSDALEPNEIRRLYRAIVEVLREAIKCGGSTLEDDQFVDLFGAKGTYQLEHRVYGRAGEPCPRCHRPIQKTKLGGRSTYFCEVCQV